MDRESIHSTGSKKIVARKIGSTPVPVKYFLKYSHMKNINSFTINTVINSTFEQFI
jgi:hypothetical protein